MLLRKREDGDELGNAEEKKALKQICRFFSVQNTRRVPKIIYYLCENSNSTFEEWVWCGGTGQIEQENKNQFSFFIPPNSCRISSQRELHIKRGN